MQISLYKIKRIFKQQRALFVSTLVFIFLLSIIFIFYMRFNQQKKEVELMTGEVQMLKNRYDTLKYNTSLTENQIKDYNKLLASLVPETEDFFSIIYALEGISAASHFSITEYQIDVNRTTGEKLTLTIQGSGDTSSFFAFLQDYHFSGGRLVTSDKIVYGGDNVGTTRIALTFYNKRFTFNESVQVPQLSKAEIDKLEAIKQKISFQFSSSGYQTVSTDYPQKTNPFSWEAKQ